MARPTILCVRNEPTDSLGVAPGLLHEAGSEVVIWDAFEDTTFSPGLTSILPSPKGGGKPSWRWGETGLDALVVFGGEMNADQLDRYPYLLRVRAMMRRAVDRGIPTLGICLGAQILARALGARVYRAPVRELGFQPIFPSPDAVDDPLLNCLRPGDHFFEWHEDTFDLPAGASLLATGSALRNQAYRVGSGWGIQFHPEVDAAEIRRWLTDAGPTVESTWGRTPAQVLVEADRHLPEQTRRARRLFRAFAGLAAQTSDPAPLPSLSPKGRGGLRRS